MLNKYNGIGNLIRRREILTESKNRLMHEIESKGLRRGKFKAVSKKVIKNRREIASLTKQIYRKISSFKNSGKFIKEYETTI